MPEGDAKHMATILGLEIWLNGNRLCVAGVEDERVMAVINIESWVLPDGTRLPSTLQVCAIKDFISLEWPGAKSLVTGDEILLKVVETSEADEPVRSVRKTAEEDAAQERLRYEDLKRKYGSQ